MRISIEADSVARAVLNEELCKEFHEQLLERLLLLLK